MFWIVLLNSVIQGTEFPLLSFSLEEHDCQQCIQKFVSIYPITCLGHFQLQQGTMVPLQGHF